MPPTDAELLRRFVEESRDDAFTELVGRRIDLVYAAAMRQAGGDAHRAKDIAQHVFIDLARKARSLCRHSSLIGWLYTSTHYAAVNAVRTEQRRRRREEEAHAMDDITRPAAAEADWEQLRPELDAAMHELKERERQLVLLRFFDRQSFAAIAEELGLTENAAQKGVERALDKLHGVLARRGITSTAAALSLVIASQAVVAAPAELAANIAGISLAASTAGASAGSALGAFFVMSKIKTGIAAAIAIAVIVPAVVELRANRALSTELGALLAGPTDVRRLQQESERLNTALATSVGGDPDFDELARLRKRVAQLEARPPGVIDADLKPAKMWRNVGRATAAAANETFHWALFTGDVATVTGLITFSDDTPENRAAFMAKFSPAVRARYPTPERESARGRARRDLHRVAGSPGARRAVDR